MPPHLPPASAIVDLAELCPNLPVATHLSEIAEKCVNAQALIISAPPGTGKTTLVPLLLKEIIGEKVLVAQPRRIAARAGAKRASELLGQKIGQEAGYSVRGSKRISSQTRVEFLTYGLLLRKLLADPELSGVQAIILDEIHERHLDSDLVLAMCAQLAQLKDDLHLIIMSATLDSDALLQLLTSQCQLTTEISEISAPSWPIVIDYAPSTTPRLRGGSTNPEFLSHIAKTTATACYKTQGDLLVFVPGRWEVDHLCRQLIDLVDPDFDVIALHGGLSGKSQDQALHSKATKRRIIVATAVAESSLTVPGVRTVIDSGLAREPRYEISADMGRLVTVTGAKSTLDQRAGRAGRIGPGTVIRCFLPNEYASARRFVTPEILTTELSEAALIMASWGYPKGQGMPLLDPPKKPMIEAAQKNLTLIGAVHVNGQITKAGRRFLSLPVDPRLARALIEGAPLVGKHLCAQVGAALSMELNCPGADFVAQLKALNTGRSPHSDTWKDQVKHLQNILDQNLEDYEKSSAPGYARDFESSVALLLALAFPNRIGRIRPDYTDSYLIASGSGALLPTDSALCGTQWLACAKIDLPTAVQNGKAGAKIRTCAPLLEADVLTAGKHLLTTTTQVDWDSEHCRVRAKNISSLGAIRLAATEFPPSPKQARPIINARLNENPTEINLIFPWDTQTAQLRARLAFLAHHLGHPWPNTADQSLVTKLPLWAEPLLDHLCHGRDLSPQQVHLALQALLPWPQAAELDQLAPTHITVASGSEIPLHYPTPETPEVAVYAQVKLQECFTMTQVPLIGGGRVKVLLHLLSPAGRPLAVTSDLTSFWTGPYQQVRAQMRGRYPKHPWPEDPLNALPSAKTKRKNHVRP